jgi:hypothetical protein
MNLLAEGVPPQLIEERAVAVRDHVDVGAPGLKERAQCAQEPRSPADSPRMQDEEEPHASPARRARKRRHPCHPPSMRSRTT